MSAHRPDAHPLDRAPLFWDGRSQAVRLPDDFRFDGDEVQIRREGDAVILEPVKERGWPPGYWEWVSEHQDDLELGDVGPMPAKLLDVDLDFDDE